MYTYLPTYLPNGCKKKMTARLLSALKGKLQQIAAVT